MARKNDVPTKTISLTGDHVHMPEDLLTAEWAGPHTVTKRYDAREKGQSKRTKFLVHGKMADFLIERDQAMEVMPDEVAEDAG